MTRVVLDPNVLVSALLSPSGVPARIVDRWVAGFFELVASPALLAETRRVAGYPRVTRRVARSDVEQLFGALERRAMLVDDPASPPRVVAGDPHDDYLVALAGEGDVLVTGDRHLLELEQPPVPVVTPRRFLEGLDQLRLP